MTSVWLLDPKIRILRQVIRLLIKPSYTASRPSHETNVSQTPEETQPNEQASNNSASISSLSDPDSTKSSWEPQKELSTFLEKQFRRKLTYDQVCEILDNYSVLSVDCLITPTLDPSVLNQIDLTQTKKYVQDCVKDVHANCFCASLLRTQIHMPRHTSNARAKY